MESSYIIERDVSWLYFNHRVLQEAIDKNVPLYERIKFLAIYSNNLDEFFQVRVAALKSLATLKKSERREYGEDVKPRKALKQIREIVSTQQELFGKVFRGEILPALEAANIFLVNCDAFTETQKDFTTTYFRTHILDKGLITPLFFGETESVKTMMKNKVLYFAVFFEGAETVPAVVEIPTDDLPRFLVLPQKEGSYQITFLDDVVRCNMDLLFPNRKVRDIYSIKLSRDTDLHLEDEFEGDITEYIRRNLDVRNIGVPTRFLYDSQMPQADLDQLIYELKLNEEDVIPGARYHNFNDFFQFPDPTNNPTFKDQLQPPLPHRQLSQTDSIIHLLKQQDVLLHFPYQSYEYVPKFILEAANDESVESIKITLYRVASKSEVGQALLYAREKGKAVTVFVEAKARFDEASNLNWGKKLKEAGATVLYSFKYIKVHTKLLLISRNEGDVLRHYSYIGTGNFNEKTAKLYTDHALMTSSKSLGKEIKQVFDLLERKILIPKTKDLLVSPFTTRRKFEKLIQREIKNVKMGKPAYIIAKMNSLEDGEMIAQLVEASQAGVDIQLIVRGICRLVPGIKGYTDNIKVISIIDRFLEHGRVYIFCNDGKEVIYISSADWMKRNLDWRVEVAVPIKDPDLHNELRAIINLQLHDNTKARQIVKSQDNPYVLKKGPLNIRTQEAVYEYLKR